MSEIETVETAATPDVLIETPVEVPETQETPTPEVGTDTEVTPEKLPETPKANEGQAQIDMYQSVLAKHAEDSNYQMTDAECDAYTYVNDQVRDGVMKDPGLKTEEKPEEDEGKTETPKPEEEGKEDPEVNIGISDANAKVLTEAMKKVGAKDISQLPEKIEGLIKTMTSSGGALGTENAALKQNAANHELWLKDLKEGKPAALAYLAEVQGKQPTPAPKGDKTPVVEDGEFNPDDFLDDKLAARVINRDKAQQQRIDDLESKVDKLSKGDEEREAVHQRRTASNGWVDEIVSLVTDYKDDFSLTPSEARALGDQYWAKDAYKNPVNPKFQEMHELISFAHKNSIPNIRHAHVVWQSENGKIAQKLIDATKKGQESVQHKTSANAFLSKNQGKMKSNVSSPNVTDESIDKMLGGDFNSIPDEWIGENGRVLYDKIPKRHYARLFPGGVPT